MKDALRGKHYVDDGEVIEENVSEKEAVKFRVNKMKTVYYLTKDTYNKKINIHYC